MYILAILYKALVLNFNFQAEIALILPHNYKQNSTVSHLGGGGANGPAPLDWVNLMVLKGLTPPPKKKNIYIYI